MTLSTASLRQTCERQLNRLRAPHLERHELLDIATTLMLLIGSIDSESAEDVAGHDLGGGRSLQSDDFEAARADLAWVQTQGRTGSLAELGIRTRCAANELCLQLSLRQSNGGIV
jgi:hypothetical protein